MKVDLFLQKNSWIFDLQYKDQGILHKYIYPISFIH